jgi:Rieske Fe-S protein
VRRGDPLDRRDALRLLGGGAATLALGPLAAGCAALPSVSATAEGGRLSFDEAELLTAMGDGAGVYIDVAGTRQGLVLLRSGDGVFTALSATCTHLGCRVRPSARALVCPCHGSAFARDGRVLRGPAQAPLPVYPVVIGGGRVEILSRPE